MPPEVWSASLSNSPAHLDQGGAAAGNHAFLECGAGSVQAVVEKLYAPLLLRRGGAAGQDRGGASRQLGEAFGVLVVLDIGRGGVELALDLGAAGADQFGIAVAPDQGGEALADADLLGGTQVLQGRLFQLAAEIARDDAASGQDRDILQHGLPPVAELRRVDAPPQGRCRCACMASRVTTTSGASSSAMISSGRPVRKPRSAGVRSGRGR